MTTQTKFPWDGQPDYAACNFALGHLIQYVEKRLSVEGLPHAETLLAAIGALAGFSALRALMAHLAETKDPAIAGQLSIVQSNSGAQYFIGEPINRMLVPANTGEANRRLWSLAAGGAVAAGLDRAKLPELRPMFAHVTQNLGGELEGPALPAERASANNARRRAAAGGMAARADVLYRAVSGRPPRVRRCGNSKLAGHLRPRRQHVHSKGQERAGAGAGAYDCHGICHLRVEARS